MVNLSRHKEELEALHLAHCAQTEKLSQIQVCPLALRNLLSTFFMIFIRIHLSYVFFACILRGVMSSIVLKHFGAFPPVLMGLGN